MEGQYSEKVMEHFRNPHNVGEIPDASGIGNVGNPVCVPADTLISRNCSLGAIKDIGIGVKVLSHDGKYHNVSKAFRRIFKNRLIDVDIHNLGRVTLTPDHHMLAMKTNDLAHKYYEYKNRIADWYMAGELKKGDLAMYPIPKETLDIDFIPMGIERPKYDFKSKSLPVKVPVNSRLLKLVGYYLSEGYVRTDKCKGTLGFVFSHKEEHYALEVAGLVKSIFGIRVGSKRCVRNSIDITFYSARLARFFENNFGKGAMNKRMPHSFLLLPTEKQKYLIQGLWNGDGCINNKGAKYATISIQLAHQLKLLLLRQKIIFSFRRAPEYNMHKENYNIYVKEEGSLMKLGSILSIGIIRPKKLKNIHKCWFDEDYFYAPVKKIGYSVYKGLIYNLEVEGSHSYVTDAATLHNCGDIMRLYIKVDDKEVITDAKFKTFGCGAAIATSSMVTDLVRGKTVEEALKVSNRAVAEALGGLPKIKMHCSVLAEEALRSAIDDYMKKKQGKQAT